MKKTIIILAVIFSCCCCNNITDKKEYGYDTFRMNVALFVLNENQVGKKYVVKYDTLNYNLEYEFTLLGEIQNSKENNLKFLFCTTFEGIYDNSQKANSNVLIFKKNKYWGHYYVGGSFEKTPVINGSDLIFFPTEWQECNLITAINFKDSIPQQIFVKCNNEDDGISGDIFSFEKVFN